MKYTFTKKNFKNFKVFKDNILPSRAYFIPYSSDDVLAHTDIRNERYSSDMVSCLSGEWDFKFYKDIRKIPNEIELNRLSFDKIHVPSDWQRTGYQEPVYLNCPYEFKTMYPSVPNKQAAAIYRKKFTIKDDSKKYILTFLGVATNVELHINGKYVGYSEGTHNTSEYDITDYVCAGENELVVFMSKWCNGSFLEAQDMFRENGIFRDVLLYAYDKNEYIFDYHFDSEKADRGYNFTVDVDVPVYTENTSVKVKLLDGEVCIAEDEKHASQKMSFEFKNADVIQWNAELPKTYTLFVTLKNDGNCVSCTRTYVGFKTIEIDGNVFKLNGKKIKIKGVNHHDSYSSKGYAMSLRDMERDVALMKEYNVNAVRTSHYPPDPYFLQLCDIYGLYVIDEADIETHGLGELVRNVSAMSMDMRWRFHYMDRVDRMYERDKNHPSILMWSLGNESGGYKCQDECYKLLKAKGTKIPVHYEGVIGTKRVAYDVVSEMYENHKNVQNIGNGTYKSSSRNKTRILKEKPFFQCEYAHAMGFGPGGLEDYWQIYYAHDNLMGGCIWEFEDHAVYHYDDPKYPYKYTYGGDHGEKQHDGNFCVDGLFYPDRRPHTGALEMKQVYRPLRISLVEENNGEFAFEIKNTNRFRSSDYLTMKYSLERDGVEIKNGVVEQNVLPENTQGFTLKLDEFDKNADYIIHFSVFDGKMGVSDEEIELYHCQRESFLFNEGKVGAYLENGKLFVEYDNGSASFDNVTGRFLSYTKDGKEFINNDGFELNVTRARLDNDNNVTSSCKRYGLDRLAFEPAPVKVSFKDGKLTVESRRTYSYKQANRFIYQQCYTFDAKGTLKYNGCLVKLYDDNLNLPRVGIALSLPAEFKNVKYFGMGPGENLPDICCQSRTGVFTSTVDEMHERYVFPQENSTHTKCRYIEFSNNNGASIKFKCVGDDYLTFTAHSYSNQSLKDAKHQEDLVNEGKTFVNIDSAVRGSGTDSCGPVTLDKYTIKENDAMCLCFEVELNA